MSIAKQGERLGYAAKAQPNASHETAHHVQTRYLFLSIFFRLVREMVAKILAEKDITQVTEDMYRLLKKLKADYNEHPGPEHPFAQLLTITDEVVFTLISLAEEEEGYKDRASFLESKEVIEGTRINPIIGPAKLKAYKFTNQVQQIMNTQQQIIVKSQVILSESTDSRCLFSITEKGSPSLAVSLLAHDDPCLQSGMWVLLPKPLPHPLLFSA
jgi:hypothetical protein